MPKKYVIGFIGKAGSGKDASALALRSVFENAGLRTQRFAFADHLKELCVQLGWDSVKNERGRNLLQHLGDVLREYHGADYFANYTASQIRESDADVCFVTDVRYLNEASALRALGEEPDCSVTLIRIVRDHSGWGKELTEAQKKHPSEVEMDQIVIDHLIENNGTIDDLRNELMRLPVVNTIIEKGGCYEPEQK